MTMVLEADELEAVIARTALTYDLLPYQSKPFGQSQPARLAALAKLFALDVAPIENARVLELGCASGGNIIPHAARYPNAKFVGVDLARGQVAAGRAKIAKLGLKNIEIHCQSITEIDDSLGEFDYIICHGVFSWVPKAVQEAILRVTRARLSKNGVACISYNVLPGWRMLQPLRDAVLLEIPDNIDPHARVAKARELLNFLKDNTPDRGPYGEMLRASAERLATFPDDYIAHEFLEETNAPSTLREFAASAALHDLGYLGECELSSMIIDNFGANMAEQIRARVGNSLIETEQYLDLLSGRTFRQSLLVSSERLAKVDRNLSPERIANLHFVCPPGFKVETDQGTTTVTDQANRILTTKSDKVREGIELLLAAAPGSASVDDCAKDMSDEDRAMVCDAIYRMLVVGMIQVTSEPIAKVKADSKPRALTIARVDAEEGNAFTTNLRHETISIDPATRVLLPLMTGKKTKKDFVEALVKEGLAGRLSFTREGNSVTEEKDIRTVAEEHLPVLLAGIEGAGLLQD